MALSLDIKIGGNLWSAAAYAKLNVIEPVFPVVGPFLGQLKTRIKLNRTMKHREVGAAPI
jgi:hypothetical protein